MKYTSEQISNIEAAAIDLYEALLKMQDLWNDTCNSNNLGKFCWQDYQNLNEAPMAARRAIIKAKGK